MWCAVQNTLVCRCNIHKIKGKERLNVVRSTKHFGAIYTLKLVLLPSPTNQCMKNKQHQNCQENKAKLPHNLKPCRRCIQYDGHMSPTCPLCYILDHTSHYIILATSPFLSFLMSFTLCSPNRQFFFFVIISSSVFFPVFPCPLHSFIFSSFSIRKKPGCTFAWFPFISSVLILWFSTISRALQQTFRHVTCSIQRQPPQYFTFSLCTIFLFFVLFSIFCCFVCVIVRWNSDSISFLLCCMHKYMSKMHRYSIGSEKTKSQAVAHQSNKQGLLRDQK